MTVYAAPIEVFRAAMPLMGAQPPDSIDDQTDEAIAARAAYEGIVSSALTMHDWSWAIKGTFLTQDAATGDDPAYSYPLPSDCLLPRFVQLSTYPFREFVLRGRKLLCDVKQATDLKLFYTYRVGEYDWPADFGEAIVFKLASHLAFSFEQTDKGAGFRDEAKRLLRAASARDRASYKGAKRDPDPALVAAWRGQITSGWAKTPSDWQAFPNADN